MSQLSSDSQSSNSSQAKQILTDLHNALKSDSSHPDFTSEVNGANLHGMAQIDLEDLRRG